MVLPQLADGTWERVEETLRARVRTVAGREATPTAASATLSISDSQSVKTTEKEGREATTPVKQLLDASAAS